MEWWRFRLPLNPRPDGKRIAGRSRGAGVDEVIDGVAKGAFKGVGDFGSEWEGLGGGFDAEEILGGGFAGDDVDPACAVREEFVASDGGIGNKKEDGDGWIKEGKAEAEPEEESVGGGEPAEWDADLFRTSGGGAGSAGVGGTGAIGRHAAGDLIDDAVKALARGGKF